MALTITPPSVLPLPHPDTRHPRLSLARIPVSATLAANETLDARRRRGEPVLPLAFGEAGLPAHRTLRAALARDRKSTRLNSSHAGLSRMPSSA